MTTERTRSVNALTALLRTRILGIDALKPLSSEQITDVSRWRLGKDALFLTIARAETAKPNPSTAAS